MLPVTSLLLLESAPLVVVVAGAVVPPPLLLSSAAVPLCVSNGLLPSSPHAPIASASPMLETVWIVRVAMGRPRVGCCPGPTQVPVCGRTALRPRPRDSRVAAAQRDLQPIHVLEQRHRELAREPGQLLERLHVDAARFREVLADELDQ